MGRSTLATGIIIQARMGSTRLPGKVLERIAGRSLLQHVIERTARLNHRLPVVVATSTSAPDELPVGVGAEIFTFQALKRSFDQGRLPHHREHVNEYILENSAAFTIGRLRVPEGKRWPELRLTVDTVEDLERARFIAEAAGVSWPSTEQAIELCLRFA